MALARAIAADAEILILQDPTTAVDSVTEQTIAERVAAARGQADHRLYQCACLAGRKVGASRYEYAFSYRYLAPKPARS